MKKLIIAVSMVTGLFANAQPDITELSNRIFVEIWDGSFAYNRISIHPVGERQFLLTVTGATMGIGQQMIDSPDKWVIGETAKVYFRGDRCETLTTKEIQCEIKDSAYAEITWSVSSQILSTFRDRLSSFSVNIKDGKASVEMQIAESSEFQPTINPLTFAVSQFPEFIVTK